VGSREKLRGNSQQLRARVRRYRKCTLPTDPIRLAKRGQKDREVVAERGGRALTKFAADIRFGMFLVRIFKYRLGWSLLNHVTSVSAG